jgi:hypothetical protein
MGVSEGMGLRVLQIAAILCVAIVMGLSLAHALELPGKRRLTRDQYLTVQAIYYPGFTLGGAAEPLSILVVAVLLVLTAGHTLEFWLEAAALFALVVVQVLFWRMTQPVNRYWLEHTSTTSTAQAFFGSVKSGEPRPEWTALRNRWERSHVLRAIAAMVALVLLVTAVLV